MSGAGWYHDPVTGLPTIRQAKVINDYPTPEEVKLMMSGKQVIDENLCPLCGGPLPENGGHEHEQ